MELIGGPSPFLCRPPRPPHPLRLHSLRWSTLPTPGLAAPVLGLRAALASEGPITRSRSQSAPSPMAAAFEQQYDVRETLGKGTFADVKRAVDRQTGAPPLATPPHFSVLGALPPGGVAMGDCITFG